MCRSKEENNQMAKSWNWWSGFHEQVHKTRRTLFFRQLTVCKILLFSKTQKLLNWHCSLFGSINTNRFTTGYSVFTLLGFYLYHCIETFFLSKVTIWQDRCLNRNLIKKELACVSWLLKLLFVTQKKTMKNKSTIASGPKKIGNCVLIYRCLISFY